MIILETDQISEIGELKALSRNVPIILLHKNANHRVGLAAIREGASEYLTEEEMGSGTLFRVLRYCVERAQVE